MSTEEKYLEGPESVLRVPLPMPQGGYTVADLLAMPETHTRIELTDGALTVSPSASSAHQYVAMMLGARLEDARPETYAVNQDVDVHLSERTTRRPDVLIVRSGISRAWPYYAGEDLVVAVEIESPTSGRMDRIVKPLVYADYKIPYYWRIEINTEPVAIVHHLKYGGYVEVSRGPRIEVSEPFPFSVDLTELMGRYA
ncbi:Uma2 family endonuclease [Cryptosporangium phraense]|uniref:Uma2 family endonuclease n=1 Tax=Cryptosporangium phraense TaxID=2593070 RepID=UPI0014789886|nr:Uma2 family endonuclease [Cryptosporangium phraense]